MPARDAVHPPREPSPAQEPAGCAYDIRPVPVSFSSMDLGPLGSPWPLPVAASLCLRFSPIVPFFSEPWGFLVVFLLSAGLADLRERVPKPVLRVATSALAVAALRGGPLARFCACPYPLL